MKTQVFEYVICTKNTEKVRGQVLKAEMVVARDERDALIYASRDIPDGKDSNDVEIFVRPFSEGRSSS